MVHAITKEVVAALLMLGVKPLFEEAEYPYDDDILRFAGTNKYLGVCPHEITLNEQMEVGGNVQEFSWPIREAENMARLIGKAVHEFCQMCGAEIVSSGHANQ